MNDLKMKIGELARQTGVTIRTLRYYEEIRLLVSSEKMESGYRLYGSEEIEQLQRIMSLKQLGLSLEEIRRCLEHPDFSLEQIISKQMQQLEAEMVALKQLYHQLEMLAEYIGRPERVSVDEFIKTIQIMKKQEKYFTHDQRKFLHERFKKLGKVHIYEVEQQWAKLIDEVRTEMEKGTDPSDEAVQELAQRWQTLLKEFTIQQSLNTMYQNEDPREFSHGAVDQAVMDCLVKVVKAGKQAQ